MWRSLWRSIDRFSLQHFKYIVKELQEIKVVDRFNREAVVDILQSIVEIVTYGDKHDPEIFECFMEYQVMSEFVRVLNISRNSRIEAPLLQYLSIMIQNMESDHAIYYCFSNDYVNTIIMHPYKFDGGDLVPYYISFLRAVSSKINRDTLCLLVKVNEDEVVSFPLYSEALKFARHGEKMIQIAVRAVTLNVYRVSDDMVYQHVTTSPNSDYFSDLVQSLRQQCFQVDALIRATEGSWTQERRKELIVETDKIVDDLYYFKDMLSVGRSHLSTLITENILTLLVYPILLPLLQLTDSDETNLLPITSFYLVSQILQVVDGKGIVNSVAALVLYPYGTMGMKAVGERNKADCSNHANSSIKICGETHKSVSHCPEDNGVNKNYNEDHFKNLSEYLSPISHIVSRPLDKTQRERIGLLSYIFSENQHLLLASLFLLMILADSQDLDMALAATISCSQVEERYNGSINLVDGSIFAMYMPQILNALLKILASQPPFSVMIQWHTGWFLRKLLVSQENMTSDSDFHLFHSSYQQACENLIKEFDGGWFDFIPDALRNEWASCKSALELPFQGKDAFFTLELDFCKKDMEGNLYYCTNNDSCLSWRKMVDTVKIFVLHCQLKPFICKGTPVENPLISLRSNIIASSGESDASDISSVDFGSELDLGSAVSCKIAFSKLGMKDIYLIASARGMTGKLFLLDKHPFRKQRGIVLATAPLAGLKPTIGENHPTWLHLCIREFDPKLIANHTRSPRSSKSNHGSDGRWTLGFPNAEECTAACLYISEEIRKQRSAVENLVTPLLRDKCGDLPDRGD